MLSKVQADREKKLEAILEMNINPWGDRFDNVQKAKSISDGYKELNEGQDPSQQARGAGRIILFRDMGKLIFAHLRDSTGIIQVAFSKSTLDAQSWNLAKKLDLGDIIGTDGVLKRTRTGEITIWVDKLTMLCKSLLPMPEKHHGLQDIEMRYRQRYLDLMTNPDSMETFQTRTEIVNQIRDYLRNRDYMEVETPMMQQIYGGAAARPFTTHHNALDTDLFMRISPELYLKRLLVGGMERVFEINRNFRNEGLSTRHNPEFTMMELYEAYGDYNVMMDIAEGLFQDSAKQICIAKLLARRDRYLANIEGIKTTAERSKKNKRSGKSIEEREEQYALDMERYAQALQEAENSPLIQACKECESGKLVLPWGKHLIDFGTTWRRAKYSDLVKEYSGVDIADISAVKSKAIALGIDPSGMDQAVMINEVFEETVEKHLIQPTFVMDYPAQLCPLTRRDPNNPNIALRFELYIAGMEVANAYTELNDPKVQYQNLSSQQLDGEDGETMRVMDEDFITALQHGMPPAGGMGIGIDRMVMLLTDTQSIKDVILFPMLKAESPNTDEQNQQDSTS